MGKQFDWRCKKGGPDAMYRRVLAIGRAFLVASVLTTLVESYVVGNRFVSGMTVSYDQTAAHVFDSTGPAATAASSPVWP